MLIEFAITNFRSIRDRQVMSFRADLSTQKKYLPENLIMPGKKSHGGPLLNTSVIYGANASGKSNFLSGFYTLEFIVTHSDDFKLDKEISTYEPFKLDRKSSRVPSIFEIEFIAKDLIRYRYEVQFSRYKIEKEELFFYPNDRLSVRKSLLYSRNQDLSVEFGDSYKGKRDFTINPNQLILSKSGVSHPSIVEAYRFFSTYLNYVPAHSISYELQINESIRKSLSGNNLKNAKAIQALLSAADTGIKDIFLQNFEEKEFTFLENIPEDEKQKIINKFRDRIKTRHPVYENGIITDEAIFELSEESTGTIKLLGVAGIVVEAFQNGSTVIIDELDKSLHPLLLRMIVEFFHNPEINVNHAQLIFSTHDVNLLDINLFRLDQINMVDKNIDGSSLITRLSEYSGISKVRALREWYMKGMFKGVPGINPHEFIQNFVQENA